MLLELRRSVEDDDPIYWHLKAVTRVALQALASDLFLIRDLGVSESDRKLTERALHGIVENLSIVSDRQASKSFTSAVNEMPTFFEGWLRHLGENYNLALWNLERIGQTARRLGRLSLKRKERNISSEFDLEEIGRLWRMLSHLASTSPSTYYQLRRALGQLCEVSNLPALVEHDPTKKPITRIVSATVALYHLVRRDLEAINELSPEAFEVLIADCLTRMGMEVRKVGSTYSSDGGVDLIATPQNSPFPFLLAVQAKHHRIVNRRTGPGPVKDMHAVLGALPFHAGMIVTNTSFTPDAYWWASRVPGKIQLHDIESIRNWVEERYYSDRLRNMPRTIRLTPSVTVDVW